MVVLRACVFVPVLQGQHQDAMWVSKWEKGCSNIKTYGDHCQKWQHLCLQDGSWMVGVVVADNQPSGHPRGAAAPGARLRPGPSGPPGEASVLEECGGGCCHCWISGRGGHHGPRFSTQHSGDNSNGAQKPELLTSAIYTLDTLTHCHTKIHIHSMQTYKHIQKNVHNFKHVCSSK